MYYAAIKKDTNPKYEYNKDTDNSINCTSIKDLCDWIVDSSGNPESKYILDTVVDDKIYLEILTDLGFEVISFETPICLSCYDGYNTCKPEYHEGYECMMTYCGDCEGLHRV